MTAGQCLSHHLIIYPLVTFLDLQKPKISGVHRFPSRIIPGSSLAGSGWEGSHLAFLGHLWWGSKARGSCVAWLRSPWDHETITSECWWSMVKLSSSLPKQRIHKGMIEEIYLEAWFLLLPFQKWEREYFNNCRSNTEHDQSKRPSWKFS